jgi:hypothetical protein
MSAVWLTMFTRMRGSGLLNIAAQNSPGELPAAAMTRVVASTATTTAMRGASSAMPIARSRTLALIRGPRESVSHRWGHRERTLPMASGFVG